MWYHDHAMGITRLNAYAGLASGYILRDPEELALIGSGAIPSREIPLIIQDKIFLDLSGNMQTSEPTEEEEGGTVDLTQPSE